MVPKMMWTPGGLEPADAESFNLVTRVEGMWLLTPPTSRTGCPHLGLPHAARQRSCMVRGRCQVCGRDAQPVIWAVTPAAQAATMWDNQHLVMQPPTCRECWEHAQEVCPYLRTTPGVRAYTAPHASVVGVYGTAMAANGRTYEVAVPLAHHARGWMLGRLYVVRLTDAREVHP